MAEDKDMWREWIPALAVGFGAGFFTGYFTAIYVAAVLFGGACVVTGP